MTFNEYQALAARTINKELTADESTRHALFTSCAELGEVHSLFQKKYQGHKIDREHLVKEIGDVFWALAELCTMCGIEMDEVANTNIKKLSARYPNGFEAERSLHRAEGDI